MHNLFLMRRVAFICMLITAFFSCLYAVMASFAPNVMISGLIVIIGSAGVANYFHNRCRGRAARFFETLIESSDSFMDRISTDLVMTAAGLAFAILAIVMPLFR